MVNRSMEVLDQNGEIIFLRKLRDGPAAESYGLHVARLAGLSERVLLRASRIMERLEESGKILHHAALSEAAADVPEVHPTPGPESAHEWLERVKFTQFMEDILAIEADHITPLEALNLIHTWKQLFGGKIGLRLNHRGRRNSSTDKSGPTLFD